MEGKELFLGAIEVVRNGFTKVAELLSNYLPYEAENIYLLLLVAISLYISSRTTSWLPRVRDSWAWWFGLAAVLFYILYSI